MTPRECVLARLEGRESDRIPFVMWNNKLPGGQATKDLLARDICVFAKTTAYEVRHEGVQIEQTPFQAPDGTRKNRVTYHTPAGDLTEIQQPMPGTVWTEKHVFTNAADYDAVEALLKSYRYVPCYERFLKDDRAFGEQSIGRAGTLHAPFHYVMNHLMNLETFWNEWIDNEDRVRRLMDLVHTNMVTQLHVLAQSPVHYVVIDGNTQSNIIGPDRYREFNMPYMAEACDILHKAGKITASHMDGNSRVLAHLIGQTGLDAIESFSPPPECDLPVADAIAAWPGKALICNFPPSRHLCPKEEVRRIATDLLRDGSKSPRFMMGIIEDIPTYEHAVMLAEMTRDWK